MKANGKSRRLFSVLLCCVTLLALLPSAAFAERTVTLDLNNYTSDAEDTAEGWEWDVDSHTLTLTNANFNTSGYGIVFPNGVDCTLCLKGTNMITSQRQTITDTTSNGRPEQSKKVTITGDGSLTAKTLNDSPTFDLSNFELESGTVITTGGINTLKNIVISGGSLSVDATGNITWNDGLYACGSIEITGGTVDIKAGRVALFVPGTGAAQPETGLNITGGDVTLQAGVAATYVGIDAKKDTVIDTTGTLKVNDSPVGLYAYKGDIEIKKGDIVLNNVSRSVARNNDPNGGTTTIESADYSKADAAITKANALRKEDYKDFSAVEAAINAVVRDKYFFEQDTVDGYVTAIENAIDALEYKGADYSKVDAAIAKANALRKEDCKDFSAVEAAVGAVVRGMDVTEQAKVDDMANAIENAIAALEYKGADYSKVDAAIAKASTLRKEDYKDFSAVEAAVDAVVRGKNVTEQTKVDDMANAIENAIAALEKNSPASSGSDTDDAAVPKTGDSSTLLLWMILMLLSCAGLMMLIKKRNTSK